MHNNYYFLRQLTQRLASKLKDSVISECFSQNKDELIIRLEIGARSFFVKANLSPELSTLSFTEDFQRARKNSVNLFPEIIGRRVQGIHQFNNERSFALLLSDDRTILFKMHANRANVIVFKSGKVSEVFRSNLPADRGIDPGGLDRNIDWSKDAFINHLADLKSLYFTFGKVVWRFLSENGFSNKTPEEKWLAIQHVRGLLENPVFFITTLDGKPALSLLHTGEVIKTLTDPLAAANEFFYFTTQVHTLSKERSKLMHELGAKLTAAGNYCKKNSAKLAEVVQDNHYKVWADLIMANLHAIPPGAGQVVLQNFYDEMRQEEIKLKKDLSPQKNAELFYRKAKNQHIEIERLKESIHRKEREMEVLAEKIAAVQDATDLRALRSVRAGLKQDGDTSERTTLPYHEFFFRNFRILVGRNAQSNDVLTTRFGNKEDLWLHAKDVSGSHVLIKHQSGKNFPRDVIEYAASLAAFNSKRRNESLCPVIVTPRKFVRKRKGDAPGSVVVEREEVIMVAPMRAAP